MIRIRAAERRDLRWLLDAVVRLNRNGTEADPRFRLAPSAERALAEHLEHAWFGRFLPFPAVLIVEIGDAPAGFVSGGIVVDPGILEAPPSAIVDNLWVEPEHRRAGVARALVAAFRERALRAGFPGLRVSTLFLDERARAFWRAVGLTEMYVVLADPGP